MSCRSVKHSFHYWSFPLLEIDWVEEYPVKLVTILFVKEVWVVLCIINHNLLSFEKLSRLPKAKYMVLEMRMALLENVNVWSESKDNCVSICTVLIKRQFAWAVTLLSRRVCGAPMTGRWVSRMHLQEEPWAVQEPHLFILMPIIAPWTHS